MTRDRLIYPLAAISIVFGFATLFSTSDNPIHYFFPANVRAAAWFAAGLFALAAARSRHMSRWALQALVIMPVFRIVLYFVLLLQWSTSGYPPAPVVVGVIVQGALFFVDVWVTILATNLPAYEDAPTLDTPAEGV